MKSQRLTISPEKYIEFKEGDLTTPSWGAHFFVSFLRGCCISRLFLCKLFKASNLKFGECLSLPRAASKGLLVPPFNYYRYPVHWWFHEIICCKSPSKEEVFSYGIGTCCTVVFCIPTNPLVACPRCKKRSELSRGKKNNRIESRIRQEPLQYGLPKKDLCTSFKCIFCLITPL